jgi:hypothetical protein
MAGPDPRDAAPQRRRRLRRGLIWTFAALLVAWCAWLVVTSLLIRHDLRAVRAELSTLRSDVAAQRFDHAHEVLVQLSRHTRHARTLTSGPVWAVTAQVPWIGDPLRTVRVSTAGSDHLARSVLPQVLSVAMDLTGHAFGSGGHVQLGRISNASAALHSAAAETDRFAQQVGSTSTHTWSAPVDHARADLLTELDAMTEQIRGADRAASLLPAMLGGNGPRRYFLVIQNEAESRGLGGLPGAYAIVTADAGNIRFTHFGKDDDLLHVKTDVPLDKDYLARWHQAQPTSTFLNSNVGPNFPDAAAIWVGMWMAKTGEQLDGAIAIDPTAMSYLLRISGPATMANGERITAANVVALTEQQVYVRYPDKTVRKTFLASVAETVSKQVIRSADGSGLVTAVRRAVSERRILVWSAQPAEEAVLAETQLAGLATDRGRPVSGFVVTNAAGSKLDYYLERATSIQRSECGRRTAVVATFTISNTAPRSGLPSYVTIRGDKPSYPTRPGDNRLLVSYYGTAAGLLTSVDVDGQPSSIAATTEHGLLVVALDLELPAGSARTVVVRIDEPTLPGKLDILRQPLARDGRVTAELTNRCS